MEEICEISLNEPESNNETTQEKPEDVLANGFDKNVIENKELTEKLKEFEETLKSLRNELSIKTDVINDLEKQKGSFEKEVTHVSKDHLELIQTFIKKFIPL